MKPIISIGIFLFSVFSFGQKQLKIKDVTLQVIQSGEIIVTKNGDYFYLNINLNSGAADPSKQFEIALQKIAASDIAYAMSNNVIAHSDDIVPYNFKKLKSLRFTFTKDSIAHQLYALNDEALVARLKQLSARNKGTTIEDIYLYYVLDLGNNKKIVCFHGGYIIPLKSGLKVFNFHNDEEEAYQMEKDVKLKPIEIATGHFTDLFSYYQVDTLPNKKVVFNNVFRSNVLHKSFDSIISNREFIAGYNKNKIELYNYQFKKLKIPDLRAVKLPKYFAHAHVLSKNTIKKINLLGGEYHRGDGNDFVDLSFQFPDDDATFVLIKKPDGFYIAGDLYKLVSSPEPFYLNQESKLFHTTAVDSLEFMTPGELLDYSVGHTTITFGTESGYNKKRPVLIFSRLNTGKYNLNTMDYFLYENPSSAITAINDALPKDLDFVENTNGDIYLIAKNGLYTYFPIVKEIKYKVLGKFKDDFARFELPNGKKGWLDLDGKEYLDE
ncbi:MAG: hypothetical protein PSV16_14015 [Flavobacterium sp.]|nr:hypothetical protein [Flavobacterium sp.]